MRITNAFLFRYVKGQEERIDAIAKEVAALKSAARRKTVRRVAPVQHRKGKIVRSHSTCNKGSFCYWEDSFCKKCGNFDPRTASPVA